MLSKHKHLIERNLSPVIFLFSKINPNFLTLIGSIPPLLFFVFVIYGYYYLALIVFPFFAIDFLDGMVARLSGKVTPLGSFLDSTMDRISDFLLISAFGFGNVARWEIVVLFLFSAFLVSYTRSRGELASNKTVSFDKGLLERAERIIGIVIGLVGYILAPSLRIEGYNIVELSFILLFSLSSITFLQRIIWAYRKL